MLGLGEDTGSFAGSKENPRRGFGNEVAGVRLMEYVHSSVRMRAFALQIVTSEERSQDSVLAGPWRQL